MCCFQGCLLGCRCWRVVVEGVFKRAVLSWNTLWLGGLLALLRRFYSIYQSFWVLQGQDFIFFIDCRVFSTWLTTTCLTGASYRGGKLFGVVTWAKCVCRGCSETLGMLLALKIYSNIYFFFKQMLKCLKDQDVLECPPSTDSEEFRLYLESEKSSWKMFEDVRGCAWCTFATIFSTSSPILLA